MVKSFVQSILAIAPNANVVVGDLNDFEFFNPVSILKSVGLTSLIETLPQNERYTYNFESNVKTLNHFLVSNNLRRSNDYVDILSFQASDQIQLKGVANNTSLGSVRSAVGIFINNGAELIAVVENGLNRNTNLATDTRFVFV